MIGRYLFRSWSMFSNPNDPPPKEKRRPKRAAAMQGRPALLTKRPTPVHDANPNPQLQLL